MRTLRLPRLLPLAALACALAAPPAAATTVAYWRMEADLDPTTHGLRVANEISGGSDLVSAEAFVDLSRQSDEHAAASIRAAGIDILVDLSGYMRGGRPRIAAARPAPLQAYWLGHGGGLAAPWIDYIIGDPTVTPEDW